MNRIVAKFAQLKAAAQKGFVVYIGAGDPHLTATRDLALAFDAAGVDVLELGVPFSDPLADGLVNQLAAQRGLDRAPRRPKFWLPWRRFVNPPKSRWSSISILI